MTPSLESLRGHNALSLLDCAFAERLGAVAGETDPVVVLAAALTRREAAEGHICLDLGSERALQARWAKVDGETAPSAATMRSALESSSLVEVVSTSGAPSDGVRPLVLDPNGRVYLRRYWSYQTRLASQLRGRATDENRVHDFDLLRAGLERYFPGRAAAGQESDGATAQESFDFMSGAGGASPAVAAGSLEPDRQRLAAAVALSNRLTVISGGPGTGKTATVVKILALVIEQALAANRSEPPRIRLVAPTGKAAATLAAAIRAGAERLDLSDEVRAALPDAAVTIHRALGVRSGARFGVRHDVRRPLEVDALVVDEASMVDLALMTRLFEAIPRDARVILLGDEHQLASVEAGAVMGDVCRAATPEGFDADHAERLEMLVGAAVPRAEPSSEPGALRNHVVRLTRSYRYASDRGIGALALAINRGDASAVLEILAAPDHPEVELRGPVHESREDHEAFRTQVVEGYRSYLEADDPFAMFETFAAFRVLSPVRSGRTGVEGLNRQIEAELRAAGVLESVPGDSTGRPILVTENDHTQGLFNGDIGFFVAPEAGEPARPRVVFQGPGLVEGEAVTSLRKISPGRLPAFEPAWAMTIHKSQGSEFGHVAVVISDAAAEHATRQQLYTAITRARLGVTLYASENAIAQAVERDTERSSGLGDALCADQHAL